MVRTRVDVHYPRDLGKVALRGSVAPLSWERSTFPTEVLQEGDADVHRFDLDVAEGALVELKPLLDEERWSAERNYTLLAGETLVVEPYFRRATGALAAGGPFSLPSRELGQDLSYRVFLPPSYEEHRTKRYPVLYAHDGQALFAAAPDPADAHSWRMDEALNQLYSYGAIEELIVVGVTTRERRIEMLSPTVDRQHGGGRGDDYLRFLVDTLKPHIDRRWRTRPTRDGTAMIGASMGGLFSFHAAWSRSDVFGRVACLSASLWWDDREMIHRVQGSCPVPRPWLYIDSGAALSPFEEDLSLHDGYEHTQALCKALVNHCYEPGVNIVSLTYAGFQHDASDWAARLAIPLQLLFPRRG